LMLPAAPGVPPALAPPLPLPEAPPLAAPPLAVASPPAPLGLPPLLAPPLVGAVGSEFALPEQPPMAAHASNHPTTTRGENTPLARPLGTNVCPITSVPGNKQYRSLVAHTIAVTAAGVGWVVEARIQARILTKPVALIWSRLGDSRVQQLPEAVAGQASPRSA